MDESAAKSPGAASPDQSPAQPWNQVAGSIFAPLITNQLDLERARKTSIEGRSLTVVQMSGAFVALFSAIVSLAGGKDHPLHRETLPLFATAGIFLVGAAAVGLVANYLGNSTGSFAEIPIASLTEWLKGWTDQDQTGAARRAAEDQLSTLFNARNLNTRKRRYLSWAVALEIGGVVALVLAIVRLLL
jgi:hypothetical protein